MEGKKFQVISRLDYTRISRETNSVDSRLSDSCETDMFTPPGGLFNVH